MMACAMKFSAGAVRNQLRHNRRTIEHSSNRDIDPERLEHDYVLSPDRGMTGYDYFLQRKSELYCYNRDDVKVMVGWIVTAPQDLDPARYDDFFCASYDFLENRYGKENVVQAIVHDDEGGQPHLHFCFILLRKTRSTNRAIKSVRTMCLTAANCAIFILTCNAIWMNTVWKMPTL